MEFTLPLPHMKDFAPVTADNWKTFSHRFQFYSKVQPKDIEVIQPKSESILLFLGGNSVIDVVKNFPIYNEEKDIAASIVLEMVSEICLPKFILLYERFKFFTCKQQSDECVCRFLFKLLQLSELCEFEEDADSYVADRIVHGVSDQQLRENLKHMKCSSLSAVTRICRTVTKCTNAQCCINFGTYSEAFQSQKQASGSSSSGSTVDDDSVQEATDMSDRCKFSESNSRIAMEESKTIQQYQPSFWQFEELIQNKYGLETEIETLTSTFTTRSQTAQLKVHSEETEKKVDILSVKVKTEPFDEINVKREVCDSPASDNHDESKSHILCWDTVAFDESDDELGIRKKAKGESDSDSIDDVPVTVCVPSKEVDCNSKSSESSGGDAELGKDCQKTPDPVKINGISRLKFVAKAGMPSPSLGVAVKSETKLPSLTPAEVSDFTLSSVSGNLEYSGDIFSTDRSLFTTHSDKLDGQFLPGSSAFSESDLPANSPSKDYEKFTQRTGSFFELYSSWPNQTWSSDNITETRKYGVKSVAGKKTSVLSKHTDNPKNSCNRRLTRSSKLRDNLKSPGDSVRCETNSTFDCSASVLPTVTKDSSSLSDTQDTIEEVEAVEYLHCHKNSQDSEDLADSSCKGCDDSNSQSTSKTRKIRDEKCQTQPKVPHLSAKMKTTVGKSHLSQYQPYISGKIKNVKHSDCEENQTVRDLGKISRLGALSKSPNVPRKRTRKNKHQTMPAVDVEPFLSQYGGYNSLLSNTDKSQGDILPDDCDYSEILKRSIDEIVQERKGLTDNKDCFFAQYDPQKTSENMSTKTSGLVHSESSSKSGDITGREDKEKPEVHVLNCDRASLDASTAPKMMKVAEKREIKTSEGAKRVSCLAVKL